jgi:hypothetical protein
MVMLSSTRPIWYILTLIDDVLWDVASSEDDLLGLDHIDRTRVARNGAGDLFLR